MSNSRWGLLKRQWCLGYPHLARQAHSPILGGEGLSQSIRAKPWQEEAKTSKACALLENKARKVVVSL